MIKLILILGSLGWAVPCNAGVAESLGWRVSPQGKQGAYLLLSDIHFDPFVDPALVPALDAAPAEEWDGIFKKSSQTAFPVYFDADTNAPLWQSALAALAKPGVNYDYAIITGDILAHHFDKKYKAAGLHGHRAYEAFVRKTLSYVGQSLARAVPGTPLYWALGNNDSECGDYGLVPGGPLLGDLAKDWLVVAADPAASRDIQVDGYYEAALPGKAGQFIALNTMAWSPHLSTRCAPDGPDPGQAELDWLAAHLKADATAGRSVTLAMHIPPGLNGFGFHCALPPEAFLKPEYQGPFLALLKAYSSSLRLLFAGHTHFDDFKAFSDRGQAIVGVHLTPSIGPNHGNNPSFQAGLYRREDGALLDLATYTLRNLSSASSDKIPGDWSLEYGFKQAYGQAFDSAGLAAVAKAIRAGGSARALYESYFACQTPTKAALGSDEWLPYNCAQTSFVPDDFWRCACASPSR
jgi:sphingomyelin phosphodiesterase acid-like 3